MANLKILSKTAEYGILLQDEGATGATAWKAAGTIGTSWADPALATANFRRVAYDAGSVTFDSNVTLDQYESSGQNGLHEEYAQAVVDGRSGLPTMSFSMPADKLTLAPHLAGALFGVTEDAGTPWSKSIACLGLTGAIDFSNNTAPLHTLSMTDKASADDGIILEDAIIEELNLEWDFNANGIARFVQMNGIWVGSELNFEQTMSGTTVDTVLTPYNRAESYSFATTFTVNSVDWKAEAIRRFTLNIKNNVTSNNKTTLGKAANYDVKPEYTSTIILDYNSVTEKVLNDFQDGTGTLNNPVIVAATLVSSTTATDDGGLSIAGVKGVLQSNPQIYNEEFMGVQLDIKWLADGASTPLTIIQTDTQDWGY